MFSVKCIGKKKRRHARHTLQLSYSVGIYDMKYKKYPKIVNIYIFIGITIVFLCRVKGGSEI